MQAIDRPGSFRANITSYGLKEMDSGAIAVAIRCELLSMFYDGDWNDWPAASMEAEGDVWIIKKDNGGVNKNGVESLINYAGWDGNIESIQNSTWQPTPCVVVVTEETYKNVKRLKISFVNDFDRTPGAMSNIDGPKAKELQSRYGAQLRAIAGNKQRNGTAPASRPTPPPPPAQTPVLASPPQSRNNDDLPF